MYAHVMKPNSAEVRGKQGGREMPFVDKSHVRTDWSGLSSDCGAVRSECL